MSNVCVGCAFIGKGGFILLRVDGERKDDLKRSNCCIYTKYTSPSRAAAVPACADDIWLGVGCFVKLHYCFVQSYLFHAVWISRIRFRS